MAYEDPNSPTRGIIVLSLNEAIDLAYAARKREMHLVADKLFEAVDNVSKGPVIAQHVVFNVYREAVEE